MSTPTTHTDEILLLAETLGEVKSRTEKLESEFSAQARPLEAATTALQAALSGIKSLQFHVLDNNLGQLSARVEQYRATIAEQVEVIATELKRADDENAKKSGEAADGLRAELAALRENLGIVVTQFGQQLERVQLEATQKAKEFAAIPGQPGPAGRSISGRGQYVAGSRYSAGDVVSFVGGSYLSNEDDNDEKPGAKAKRWTQLVGRGPGGGVSDVKGLTGISSNLIAWLADPTSALSIGALTASGNLTLTGAVLLGGATGGMPTSGVINAKGFKIDGVDVGSSTDTYWNAANDGIAYSAGPVFVGTSTPATPTQYNQLYVVTPSMTDNVGRGVNCTTTYAGSNAATGFNAYTFTSGSNDMDHIHGYQATVYHNGTGTLTRSAAYQAYLEANNGGTVSLGVGFYFAGIATGTGGSFTEHWAFYDIGGSPTRHSGKVYIGEALIAPVSLPNTQLYVTRDYAVVSGGLSSPTATFHSTDTAAVGVGASIALGGESGAATSPYNFGFILGAKEESGASYKGYLAFYTTDSGSNNSEKMRITSAGNVIVGTAALATDATNGFLYVPSCAGAPTGAPTSYTGRLPIVIDSTNNRLYFYSGGSWRNAGP